MQILIIKCLLVAVAAMCNAVMDTLREHYEISIFTRFNRYYWDGKVSWRNKYNFGQEGMGIKQFYRIPLMSSFSDAWHLFKSAMIITLCLALSITTLSSSFFLLQIALYGTIWNVVFDMFYNKFLRK